MKWDRSSNRFWQCICCDRYQSWSGLLPSITLAQCRLCSLLSNTLLFEWKSGQFNLTNYCMTSLLWQFLRQFCLWISFQDKLPWFFSFGAFHLIFWSFVLTVERIARVGRFTSWVTLPFLSCFLHFILLSI